MSQKRGDGHEQQGLNLQPEIKSGQGSVNFSGTRSQNQEDLDVKANDYFSKPGYRALYLFLTNMLQLGVLVTERLTP